MIRDLNKVVLHWAALSILTVGAILAQGCARGAWRNPHGPTFNGTIQSADLVAHRLTIAPLKSGKPVVFVWDEQSRFWANGLRVDPSFLQAGEVVRIHYWVSEDRWAVQHLYLQTHRTVH